jgi:hypothetical protein
LRSRVQRKRKGFACAVPTAPIQCALPISSSVHGSLVSHCHSPHNARGHVPLRRLHRMVSQLRLCVHSRRHALSVQEQLKAAKDMQHSDHHAVAQQADVSCIPGKPCMTPPRFISQRSPAPTRSLYPSPVSRRVPAHPCRSPGFSSGQSVTSLVFHPWAQHVGSWVVNRKTLSHPPLTHPF